MAAPKEGNSTGLGTPVAAMSLPAPNLDPSLRVDDGAEGLLVGVMLLLLIASYEKHVDGMRSSSISHRHSDGMIRGGFSAITQGIRH